MTCRSTSCVDPVGHVLPVTFPDLVFISSTARPSSVAFGDRILRGGPDHGVTVTRPRTRRRRSPSHPLTRLGRASATARSLHVSQTSRPAVVSASRVVHDNPSPSGGLSCPLHRSRSPHQQKQRRRWR